MLTWVACSTHSLIYITIVYPGHVGYKKVNENLVVFVELFISYFMLCFHINMHCRFSVLML